MKLAVDLQILRNLRTEHKAATIKFVAHLYTEHAEAMDGITPDDLADIVFSPVDMKFLAKELEGS